MRREASPQSRDHVVGAATISTGTGVLRTAKVFAVWSDKICGCISSGQRAIARESIDSRACIVHDSGRDDITYGVKSVVA